MNNPTPQRETRYKCYKNKLNHVLRNAKRLYYEKKIEESKSNVKSTWRLLNEVLNRRKGKQKLPSIFKLGDQELPDPNEIAEHFCEYFTNIGPNLANKLQKSTKSYKYFLTDNFPNSLFLREISKQEVDDICSSLSPGKAIGYDGIPFNIIKETITSISSPFTHIFNLSLTSRVKDCTCCSIV